MPYIKKDERATIHRAVINLANKITGDGLKRFAYSQQVEKEEWQDGRVTYAITMLMDYLYHYPPEKEAQYPTIFKNSYGKYARALGILEATKLEFYRRKVAPYEDKKIKENGDLER